MKTIITTSTIVEAKLVGKLVGAKLFREYCISHSPIRSAPTDKIGSYRKAPLTAALAVLLALTPITHADMQELTEEDLQQATGQEGITISAKLDFAEGTRISTINNGVKRTDYINQANADNWQVLENITGSIEAKGIRTDLLASYGTDSNGSGVSAAQTTLPEKITFEAFQTDGLYLGPGETVSRDGQGKVTSHNFMLGLEIDGTLSMPAQTKITTFVVK